MRPALAIFVATSILGGLWLYMQFRPQPARRSTLDVQSAAPGRFSVEVTLTFDAGPDPFALDLQTAPSLLVQHRGREIWRSVEPIPGGEQIRIDNVMGIVTGNNEFYVQATPRDLTSPEARAVRVRVLRDDNPLADQTLWAEPGEVVQGAIEVRVPAWAGAEPSAASTAPSTRPGDADNE